MRKKQSYTVAGHSFCLINEQNDAMWERMNPQYASFVDNRIQEPLFTLTVTACNELSEIENTDFVYKDPNPNPREAKIDVYRTDSGHLFELTPHGGGELHSKLHLSADFKQGELLLRGDTNDRFCGLNSALMLCYLLATVRLDTALMHASAIMNNGTAYLFLGRSGTGKSTHSNLWLQHIPGSELLNDDHPIIRIDAKGEAIVYGSPWSGKTPCYRNQSAPIGGVVRIKQAPHNHIRKLSPIEAYASLVTSSSGMSWDKELGDGKDRTLQKIIATVPCYTLQCLPNEHAAELCALTVRKKQVWNE